MGVRFGDIGADTVVPVIEGGVIRCKGVAGGISFYVTETDGAGVTRTYQATYSAHGFRISTEADDGSEQYVSVSPYEVTVRGVRLASVGDLKELEARITALEKQVASANSVLEAAL